MRTKLRSEEKQSAHEGQELGDQLMMNELIHELFDQTTINFRLSILVAV